MGYRNCLQREEIRVLNELTFGNDIVCLCAAEMDGMTESSELIEIKCSTIRTRYNQKIPGIANSKLLKYWTQSRFGGVDSLVIAFHEQGIVQKTICMTTKELEAMFPVISAQCITLVHDVLQWMTKE